MFNKLLKSIALFLLGLTFIASSCDEKYNTFTNLSKKSDHDKQLAELSMENETLKKKLTQASSQRERDYQKDVEAKEKTIKKTSERIEKLKEKIAHFKNLEQNLNEEVAASSTAKNDLEAQIVELKRAVSKSENKLQNLSREKENLEERLKSQIFNLTNKAKANEEALERLKNQLDQNQAALATKEQLLKDSQNALVSVAGELKKAQDKQKEKIERTKNKITDEFNKHAIYTPQTYVELAFYLNDKLSDEDILSDESVVDTVASEIAKKTLPGVVKILNNLDETIKSKISDVLEEQLRKIYFSELLDFEKKNRIVKNLVLDAKITIYDDLNSLDDNIDSWLSFHVIHANADEKNNFIERLLLNNNADVLNKKVLLFHLLTTALRSKHPAQIDFSNEKIINAIKQIVTAQKNNPEEAQRELLEGFVHNRQIVSALEKSDELGFKVDVIIDNGFSFRSSYGQGSLFALAVNEMYFDDDNIKIKPFNEIYKTKFSSNEAWENFLLKNLATVYATSDFDYLKPYLAKHDFKLEQIKKNREDFVITTLHDFDDAFKTKVKQYLSNIEDPFEDNLLVRIKKLALFLKDEDLTKMLDYIEEQIRISGESFTPEFYDTLAQYKQNLLAK